MYLISKRQKMKIFFLTIGSLVIMICFSGCLTNPEISKQFTSSSIGCETQDISIFNETAALNGMHAWTAECKGKQYLCTYHETAGARCTEKR